mmetsp:Transcript_6782/g.14157  ORF Transcript_6782/g.14157 Transcript_6782/m.14157 type:complete len:130 (+) Transcript_6782:107-496(+)
MYATLRTIPRTSRTCSVCVRGLANIPPAAPNQLGDLEVEDLHKMGNKSAEELRKVNHTGQDSIYALGKHRSNALELVHRVPIVEVETEWAICDGGGGAMGHPIEYISLEVPGAVEYCKYCSIRFTKKKH